MYQYYTTLLDTYARTHRVTLIYAPMRMHMHMHMYTITRCTRSTRFILTVTLMRMRSSRSPMASGRYTCVISRLCSRTYISTHLNAFLPAYLDPPLVASHHHHGGALSINGSTNSALASRTSPACDLDNITLEPLSMPIQSDALYRSSGPREA